MLCVQEFFTAVGEQGQEKLVNIFTRVRPARPGRLRGPVKMGAAKGRFLEKLA
jgi:hypothetical protein